MYKPISLIFIPLNDNHKELPDSKMSYANWILIHPSTVNQKASFYEGSLGLLPPD